MNNYPVERPPGQEHILVYPRGFIAIRIIQLVLAVLILGLSAYTVYFLAYDGNSFILAVAIMTLISSIYLLVAKYGATYIYNYWAILGLDIFFIVMWLSAFALQASRVAPYFAYVATTTVSSSYYYGYSESYTTYEVSWLGAQAAAAALGGIEFVLYIVALIIHSIRLHRHRAAGFHCMPGMARTLPTHTHGATAAVPVQGGVFVPAEKIPLYHQSQAHAYPQQTQPAFNPPQQQQQQQQGGYPAQSYPVQQTHNGQAFYAPQPSQSPPPPQQLVAQPTGSSYVNTPQGPMPPQLPGN